MKHSNVLYAVIVVTTVSILCISSLGWAQQPQEDLPPVPPAHQEMEPPGPGSAQNQGEYGDLRINWMLLGLSKEQKEQIQQKRREFQISTAATREELRFVEQDLREEMGKDPVDRTKIDSVLKNISTLKQQISEAAVQNLLAIKSVLTPEQLEKLAEFQSQLPVEFKRLGLTPEQRSQIQEILKSSLQQNRETTEILHELKAELREMLLAPQEVDSGKLKQLQTDIAEKEFALEKGRVEMLLQMKEVLTPDQRQKLQKAKALFQRVRERREEKLPFVKEKTPPFPAKQKNR
jgi:Spy/CpxP family protein refolding chaperone